MGGGSELSGRPRPGACGGAWADGRERGQGWGSGCKFMGVQRPQSISKPPPGVGGGRPNRPGVGVGFGILAERFHTAAKHFKPPPGVGGGRPNRPGAGVGTGSLVTHVCRIKADATRPLFCEGRAKKGAAGRTLSAAERLSSYDNIATYPSDLWGRSTGVGAPARSSP